MLEVIGYLGMYFAEIVSKLIREKLFKSKLGC
jgi:hypothetical protein